MNGERHLQTLIECVMGKQEGSGELGVEIGANSHWITLVLGYN